MKLFDWTQRFFLIAMISLLFSCASGVDARQQPGTPGPAESDRPPVALVLHPAGQGLQSFFDLEMNPGETTTLSLVAGNNGTLTAPVVLYTADAYTLRNGGFGLNTPEFEQTGPTLWTDLQTEELELESGSTIERSFQVSVPTGTPPGEYMTGVALETRLVSEEQEETEGVTFRIENQFRVVRAIRVTVPGPIEPGIEIGDTSVMYLPSDTIVVVDVENSGNVLIQPSGEITISDADGNSILSGPVEMGVVYSPHTAELWFPLGVGFPAGNYTLTLALSDERRGISASVSDVPFTIEESGASIDVLAIETASVEPIPVDGDIQIATVTVDIRNGGEPITNARLTLVAYLDGEEVDRFAVNQSLSIPNGMSGVTTRYVPLSGWTSGEWSFEVLLETVDPNGTALVVSRLTIEDVITVP